MAECCIIILFYVRVQWWVGYTSSPCRLLLSAPAPPLLLLLHISTPLLRNEERKGSTYSRVCSYGFLEKESGFTVVWSFM